EKYTFTQFKNMKVTDSLRLKENIIINLILNKFKLRHYTKKRKIEESAASSPSPNIVSENIGHTFEDVLHKLFNDNGIIAYIIQVSEGDGGLDLLLSYQGNQICVQSKDRENALILSMVKDFEAMMIHFKSLLEILVYNSETMRTEKYLTKQAKLWLDNSTQELI
ncbi:3974_t:CDS:2, partial [Racocetra persica]